MFAIPGGDHWRKMHSIEAIAGHFDALSAQNKARCIAVVCAVLSILTGFVLYIVLTHTFEHGDLGARFIALILGLGLSIGVARVAEWLSETINTGEAELGKTLARAVPTAIILLVVFELCISTFDEFAKATVGDFATVREIAARVAGQSSDEAAFDATDQKLAAFYATLRKQLQRRGMPDADTVEGRVLRLMPTRDRATAFYNELPPSDDEVIAMGGAAFGPAGFLDPPGATAGERLWTTACRSQVSLSPFAGNLAPAAVGGLAPDAQARSDQVKNCREALAAMKDEDRIADFISGLNSALRLHDLYDAHVFGKETDGRTFKEAATQRGICDAAREGVRAKFPQPATCLDAVLSDDTLTRQSGLLPRAEIMALNRELLARAMPQAFTPLPIDWLDLFFLVAMWCTAAAALAIFLCDSVFEIESGSSFLAAWKTTASKASLALIVAPLLTGAILIALRLAFYVWALMFDTASVAPHEIWSGLAAILQSVPLAVSWLDSGGIFGWHIPGWLTLPVAIGGLLFMVGASSNSSNNALGTFAGFALLGILVGGIAPVLGGILMVMLLILVTWLVPAFGLSTLLPYLEPGARVPRWWGLIALAAAAAIAIWAGLRWWAILFQSENETLSPTILVATSFSLALTSIFILRERPIRDLWPLVAVTVAFCLLGGAVGVQQATFYGVVREVAGVTAPIAPRAARTSSLFDTTNAFSYLYAGSAREERDVGPSERHGRSEIREAAHLELALVGSLGFWLTIALLAAWSLRQRERELGLRPAAAEAAAVAPTP